MLSRLPRKGRLVGDGYDIDIDGYKESMLPGVRVNAIVRDGLWAGTFSGVLLGFSKERYAHIRAAPRTTLFCGGDSRDFSGVTITLPVSCIISVLDSFGDSANIETDWDFVDVSEMELPNE